MNPPPLHPLPPGEGKFTFYEIIKLASSPGWEFPSLLSWEKAQPSLCKVRKLLILFEWEAWGDWAKTKNFISPALLEAGESTERHSRQK